MKKKIIKLVLLLTAKAVNCDDFACHSFFTVRPQFRLVAPEKEALFRNDRMLLREGGIEGTTQVTVYGGQSNNDLQLNRYFLPSNKTALTAQEYKAPNFTQDGLFVKDLEARNFNIETQQNSGTTFKSTILFKPQQTSFGIGLSWIQNLWHDTQGVPRIWGEISFPVQYIKNEMKLHEYIVDDGGGVSPTIGLDGAPHVANMTEAFKQKTWLYGKVDNCADLDAWGVSDIEITCGYNALTSDTCDFNAYGGFVVPTGTKIDQKNAAYIWRPVVGDNHHWGLLFGAHAGFIVFEHKLHRIDLEFDAEGQYLFKNTQWRTFDLVQQGQWSRYLEVYQNLQQATQAEADSAPLNMNAGTSGINVFTTCAHVHPKFTVNTNSGFIYTWKGLQVELGFNFFVRQAEEITKCSWNTDVAIKNITGEGQTNIARTIKDNFTGSAISLADYKHLTLSDLDLNSAAHPTTLTHTIYLALGWNWNDIFIPTFFGAGASYEFTTVTCALNRWLLFGKAGISF
ncbi:MAG: hypothetical protein K2X90_03825 [Candidatus Babeliaceae bacterium]|nr:hypothetical protein [Candidatus Babeliaceae bacterium]